MGPKYFPGNLVHENNNIRLRPCLCTGISTVGPTKICNVVLHACLYYFEAGGYIFKYFHKV